MAKNRKSHPGDGGDAVSRKKPEVTRTAGAPPLEEETSPSGDAEWAEPQRRFGIGAYLLLNAIFIAFCLAQFLLVRVVLGEQKGLVFFFSLLAVSFLVVSVFDYLYDRHIDPVRGPAR